jgi:hypothetical protein
MIDADRAAGAEQATASPAKPTRGEQAYPVDVDWMVHKEGDRTAIAATMTRLRMHVLELQAQVDAMRPVIDKAATMRLNSNDRNIFFTLNREAGEALSKVLREDGQ